MRIYTSRRHHRRSWAVVLVSCLGLYLVLALGFRWLLQPTVEAAAAKLPSVTLAAERPVAEPDRRPAEVATPSAQSRRAATPSRVTTPPTRVTAVGAPGDRAAPRTSTEAKQPPARAAEPATAATAEQEPVTPPKKEPKKKVARKTHDRSGQQAYDPRGSWNFASSPYYRPWF